MKLQITFSESLPAEHHAMAERALRTAIDWLDAQPRPKATPPIENLIPDWSKMKFTLGGETWGRGLFNQKTMGGWAVVNVRLNGDCVLGLDKPIVIPDVDVELATVIGAIGMLNGYYYSGIDSDKQLLAQLAYIDSIAPTNAKAKSLQDQWEEQQEEQAQADRDEWYKQQLEEKRYLQARKYAYDTAMRVPSWYVDLHEDSPQLQRDYLITSGGAVIGKHVNGATEDLEQSGQAAPPPNLAVQQIQGEQPPLPMPQAPPPMEPMATISTDDEEAEIASWQALYDAAMGRTTKAASCQNTHE